MRRLGLFWNVERFFDPAGLPVARAFGATGDSWTPAMYEAKLRHVAAVLLAATGGQAPALLALAEVESVRIQRDLRAACGWEDDLVIIDDVAPDPTLDGLDVALLVDRSVFDTDVLTARSLSLDNRFSTRDLLDVRVPLRVGAKPVAIAVAHWPSRVIAEGESLRFAYSVYLRRLAEDTVKYRKSDLVGPDGSINLPPAEDLAARWGIPVLMVGDFNDEPYDPSIRRALDSTSFLDVARARSRLRGKALREADNYLEAGFLLHNPCWNLRFSDTDEPAGTYYRSEWRTYDQVLVSPGGLDEDSGLCLRSGSTRVFRHTGNLGDEEHPIEMATRTGLPRSFEAAATTTGASDHFPLTFELELAEH